MIFHQLNTSSCLPSTLPPTQLLSVRPFDTFEECSASCSQVAAGDVKLIKRRMIWFNFDYGQNTSTNTMVEVLIVMHWLKLTFLIYNTFIIAFPSGGDYLWKQLQYNYLEVRYDMRCHKYSIGSKLNVLKRLQTNLKIIGSNQILGVKNYWIIWLNLIFQMVWGEISACFLGSHPTPPPARFNCCTFLPSHLFGLDDEEKIQISQSHWWGRANLMKYKCTKIISDFNISALHSINCEHAYHSNYEVFDHVLKKS